MKSSHTLPWKLEATIVAHSIRLQLWIIAGLVVLLVSTVLCTVCAAQTTTVTRVEEDWELLVVMPSYRHDAPQVTCVMAPVGNTDSLYATFNVNHHDTPRFEAGGLQVEGWNAKDMLATKQVATNTLLATPNETIRWTQVMELTPDGLIFQVTGGTSTTWGEFGSGDSLKIVLPSTLSNLDGYNPTVSSEHSNVSFGVNRVQSFTLKEVRTYGATGLISRDTTPRVVHALNQ